MTRPVSGRTGISARTKFRRFTDRVSAGAGPGPQVPDPEGGSPGKAKRGEENEVTFGFMDRELLSKNELFHFLTPDNSVNAREARLLTLAQHTKKKNININIKLTLIKH